MEAAIDDNIPLYFKCSITLHLMEEPTFCMLDGNIYEGHAIRQWLEEHNFAPLDPSKCMKEGQTAANVLSPIRAMKEAIDLLKAEQSSTTMETKSV